jgi:hypothetical protein
MNHQIEYEMLVGTLDEQGFYSERTVKFSAYVNGAIEVKQTNNSKYVPVGTFSGFGLSGFERMLINKASRKNPSAPIVELKRTREFDINQYQIKKSKLRELKKSLRKRLIVELSS